MNFASEKAIALSREGAVPCRDECINRSMVGAPRRISHAGRGFAGQTLNSAVLITQQGGVQYHDKVKLLPLAEYVPEWMRTESTMRWLEGATLEPGVPTTSLQLTTRANQPMRIPVALCYEKFSGSLPQFHTGQSLIIHLTQNSWCRDHPLIPQLELWSCQYRAIETRAWQVQVASWQGSCVIDPRGGIRQSLGSTEGWLIFPRVQ